jgi:hypothetical protein
LKGEFEKKIQIGVVEGIVGLKIEVTVEGLIMQVQHL